MDHQGKTGWGTVLLAVVAGMVAAAHVGKLPPALPALRAELGLGLVAAGWIVSVFSVTGLAMGMFAGTLGDRIGARRLMLLGLAALVGGSLGGSLADGEALLLVTRVIEGLGFLAVAVSAPTLIIAVSHGGGRRLAFGMWGTYMPAGISLMILATPALLAQFGWRGVWQAIGAVSLLWLAVMAIGTRPRAGSSNAVSTVRVSFFHNLRVTLGRPVVTVMALCFGLYSFSFAVVMVWLPSFLIEERAIGTGLAAVLTALVVGANVPGNLLGGWLMHRGFPVWSLIALSGAGMGLSSLGIFGTALPDGARYALCLLFAGSGGVLPPAIQAGAPAMVPGPSQIGTASGMVVQGSHLGQFLSAPTIAAVVAASGSWNAALWPLVAAAILNVALALVVRRYERAM